MEVEGPRPNKCDKSGSNDMGETFGNVRSAEKGHLILRFPRWEFGGPGSVAATVLSATIMPEKTRRKRGGASRPRGRSILHFGGNRLDASLGCSRGRRSIPRKTKGQFLKNGNVIPEKREHRWGNDGWRGPAARDDRGASRGNTDGRRRFHAGPRPLNRPAPLALSPPARGPKTAFE